MTMSVPVAIVATLIAAFMFALWYQFLNHLKQFPLPGFVFWLYISAYVTVWVAVLSLGGRDLPNGIMAELEGKYGLALLCIFGGICMTSGLIISLIHMKANGMVANQAIAGSIGSILGLIVTFVVGGLAPGIPLSGVLIASAVIILASIVIQQSSIYKFRERGIDLTSRDIDQDKSMPDSILKQNLMLVLSNVLSIGYSIAFIFRIRANPVPEDPTPIRQNLNWLPAKGPLFRENRLIRLPGQAAIKALLPPHNRGKLHVILAFHTVQLRRIHRPNRPVRPIEQRRILLASFRVTRNIHWLFPLRSPLRQSRTHNMNIRASLIRARKPTTEQIPIRQLQKARSMRRLEPTRRQERL